MSLPMYTRAREPSFRVMTGRRFEKMVENLFGFLAASAPRCHCEFGRTGQGCCWLPIWARPPKPPIAAATAKAIR